MTPVPRITCEICPGLLPPFFHPRIKLRARIAHGGGRRPGNEASVIVSFARALSETRYTRTRTRVHHTHYASQLHAP